MSKAKRLFILEKAIELFSVHGFEAVSIQDITNHCGISKGAFYLSFKSKDELMLAIFEHLLTSLALIFDRSVSSQADPQARLQQLFEELLLFMHMNRGIAMFVIHEQLLLQTKNKQMFCVLLKYEAEQRAVLGQLIDSVYGAKITEYKEDLILTLNSLFRSYFEYVCLRGLDVETSRLAQSLVEKTNILARAHYSYAIPDEYFTSLAPHQHFTDDELLEFKSRIIQDIAIRSVEETTPMLHQALMQAKYHLEQQSPDASALYAYSSLLREYDGYKDLALRLRSYTKMLFPQ